MQVWWNSTEDWWRPVIIALAVAPIAVGALLLIIYTHSKNALSQAEARRMRAGFLRLLAICATLPLAAVVPTFGTAAYLAFEAIVGVAGLCYAVVIYWRGAPRQKILMAAAGGALLAGSVVLPDVLGRSMQLTLAGVLLIVMSLYPDRARTS